MLQHLLPLTLLHLLLKTVGVYSTGNLGYDIIMLFPDRTHAYILHA